MHTKESIITLLDTNDKAVVRAVICIYKRQTSAEQNIKATKEHNGVGFNSSDAPFLSYCAEFAIKNGTLSGDFLEKSRKKIKKYWKQLLCVANTKPITS